MRNVTNPTLITGKNSKKKENKGKSFGYAVLGFGAGGVKPIAYVTATGGTITTVDTNYKVHVFTGPGTFQVTCAGEAAGSNTVDYLVIAGAGGGGSGGASGGGAAGGYRESSGTASGSYTVSPRGSEVAALPVSPLLCTKHFPSGRRRAYTSDRILYIVRA